jgi:hypothetical protein
LAFKVCCLPHIVAVNAETVEYVYTKAHLTKIKKARQFSLQGFLDVGGTGFEPVTPCL